MPGRLPSEVIAEFAPLPQMNPQPRLMRCHPFAKTSGNFVGHRFFDLPAPPTARSLLIVGHNPGLHAVALMLVASGDIDARERLREKMPTCGLVIIDFAFDDWGKLHPQSGRLERFVSPKSLSAAAN